MRVLLQAWECSCKHESDGATHWCNVSWYKFIVRPKVFFEHAQNTLLVVRPWAKWLKQCNTSCNTSECLVRQCDLSHVIASTRPPIVTDPLVKQHDCESVHFLVLTILVKRLLSLCSKVFKVRMSYTWYFSEILNDCTVRILKSSTVSPSCSFCGCLHGSSVFSAMLAIQYEFLPLKKVETFPRCFTQHRLQVSIKFCYLCPEYC